MFSSCSTSGTRRVILVTNLVITYYTRTEDYIISQVAERMDSNIVNQKINDELIV
jgi:hypothetical protein